jgi:hypothetical protein
VPEPTGASKFTLFWKLPMQRVARREAPPAPFEWRATLRSRTAVCGVALMLWTVAIESRLLFLQVVRYDEMKARADDQYFRQV